MSQPSLLARLKARYETDLTDSELQRVLDEAKAAVVERFGPSIPEDDAEFTITVTAPGTTPTIDLARPINTGKPIIVTEHYRNSALEEDRQTELDDTQYRVWFGGRTLERVYGTSPDGAFWWGRSSDPAGRFGWGGSRGWVTIEYTPVNDGNQREEVILQLAIVALEFDPALRVRVGNVEKYPVDFQATREAILARLAPRRGLMIR